FQYLRPNYKKLHDAISELGTYVHSKGASIEIVAPPQPLDPETRPFDQDKSSSYGQGSVTQPYHSPAQIAAAAQGNLHPSYHMGNQHNAGFHQGASNGFHQGASNGVYHQNHGGAQHQNGYHGHSQPQQHYGRGYQQMAPGFVPNRGGMNGHRHGHNNHNNHHNSQFGIGYTTFQPHPANRGGNMNHSNHHGHYNGQYNQGGGMNNSMNGSN